jgi:hypothetical protein
VDNFVDIPPGPAPKPHESTLSSNCLQKKQNKKPLQINNLAALSVL